MSSYALEARPQNAAVERFPKMTKRVERISTEVFQIICGPWAHRLRRYRFPVGPRGPAPTTSGGAALPRHYSLDYLDSIDHR